MDLLVNIFMVHLTGSGLIGAGLVLLSRTCWFRFARSSSLNRVCMQNKSCYVGIARIAGFAGERMQG